jgi:hypothetical protein
VQFKGNFLRSAKVGYPQGARDLVQMRDIIRVYAMGWFDALMETTTDVDANSRLPALVRLKELEKNMAVLHATDWWPDRSWKWWGKE